MSKIIKKNVSVYITLENLRKLDKLIENYIFSNRSFLVNYCIDLAFPILLKEFEKIKKAIEINDLPKVLEFLKSHGFVIRLRSHGERKNFETFYKLE